MLHFLPEVRLMFRGRKQHVLQATCMPHHTYIMVANTEKSVLQSAHVCRLQHYRNIRLASIMPTPLVQAITAYALGTTTAYTEAVHQTSHPAPLRPAQHSQSASTPGKGCKSKQKNRPGKIETSHGEISCTAVRIVCESQRSSSSSATTNHNE